MQNIKLVKESTLKSVKILVDLNITKDQMNVFINKLGNIHIGWHPEDDENELPDLLPCWMEVDFCYTKVGTVFLDDDLAMRKRLVEHQKFYQHGGLGSRAFNLETTNDGKNYFLVDLI